MDKIRFRKFKHYGYSYQKVVDASGKKKVHSYVWYIYVNGKRFKPYSIKQYTDGKEEYLVLKNNGLIYLTAGGYATIEKLQNCAIYSDLSRAKHALLNYIYSMSKFRKVLTNGCP